MSDFSLAEAMINFASGTDANWNTFQLPIAKDVIIYTTNTKSFKVGNGNQKYSDLPVSCTIDSINAGSGQVNTVLTTLLPGDTDSIIFIDNEKFTASAEKLTSIVDRITAVGTKDTEQAANITTINSQFGMVDNTISVGDNSKLAIIKTNKMAPGVLPASLGAMATVPPLTVKSIKFYSDEACTIEVLSLSPNTSYYCKVDCQHDTVDINSLTISLADNNAYSVITNLTHGIFRIDIKKPAVAQTITYTATVSYNTDTISITKTITSLGSDLFTTVLFGGAGAETFNDMVFNNTTSSMYCVGSTFSEGTGETALIVKFNNNLTVLAKKTLGGAGDDRFIAVALDSTGNVYVVGLTTSEGMGGNDALIVKYDNNLNLISQKRYGGSLHDWFHGIAIDASNNIYCCGLTGEGGTSNALIVKFDTNLNIIAKKLYGSSFTEAFYRVCCDTVGNPICIGYTTSQRSGGTVEHESDAIIIKFDPSLNILAGKNYYGVGEDFFIDVLCDSANNIYAVGMTGSEGSGNYDGMIIKFDSNLNIVARKRYGGTGYDYLYNLYIDAADNVHVTGVTQSFGPGDYSCVYFKFGGLLSVLEQKIFGGPGDDKCHAVSMIASVSKILVVGQTTSDGLGSYDAFAVKFPTNIPDGTFVGTKKHLGFGFYDSAISFSNSNLTSINSTLTLVGCTNVAVASTLTAADSAMLSEIELIG